MLKTFRKLAVLFVLLSTFVSFTIVNAADTGSASSDAAYANFRNVKSGQIGSNNLYRSVHPANTSTRAEYANRLAQENGIRIVLNLADSKSSLQKRFKTKNIPSSYYYKTLYNKGQVYTANLGGGSHKGSSYRKKVTSAVKFMSKNKGPYLVHCEIGRDRTGFVMLILESLMGAPYSYMLDDFTLSDMNLYSHSYEKSKAKAVVRLNDDLHYITGKSRNTNWNKINLAKYAEKYLKKGGMSSRQISTLKKNLSASFKKTPASPVSSSPGQAKTPSNTTDKSAAQPQTGSNSKTNASPTAQPAAGDNSKTGTSPAAQPAAGDSGKTSTSPAAQPAAGDSSKIGTSPTAGDSSKSSASSAATPSAQPVVGKETPAYRNLSIKGQTTLTQTIRKKAKVNYTYTLAKGDIKKYKVECYNSNRSVIRVLSCGKGRLTIYGRKKGNAVLRLRHKYDHSKRVRLTIKVR